MPNDSSGGMSGWLQGRWVSKQPIWQKKGLGPLPGSKSVIHNKKEDLFILLPCLDGQLRILNKNGISVFEIDLKEPLRTEPIVFRNEHYLFVQPTLRNNL